MPNETQDVNTVDPSTTGQAAPVEETTVQESAPVAEETPQAAPSAIPEAVNQEGEVDERGVPYKNRYYEYKRKLAELESNLPNLIQNAVREAIPQAQAAPQQPQYTEEQLIQFKNETDDARARAWAELELRKLEDRRSEEKFRRILDEKEKKDNFAREQQMAINETMRKYPLMFNLDGSWNNDHPLTQKVAQLYNSRASFKNDGYGLLGAADMAFADYVLRQQPQLAQQQQQLKRQVKKLEKGTLVEGGGQAVKPSGKSPLVAAKERLAQTGRERELVDVSREYLKKHGMI